MIKGKLSFNPRPSTILHLDLNSCFATIEQQANPLLRGKPIAVAAYTTPNGCILAPSVEAKRFGIKTGMKVKEGKALYPNLIVLSPDPWKYRSVHIRLKNLVSNYTADFVPKSIDEFVLNMEGYSCLGKSIYEVGNEIKRRIKKEIGDWLTVSIGISTNRYLAKVASGLHKPDGLDEINKNNFLKVYLKLKLTDIPYIKLRNAIRLNSVGIYSTADFYTAPFWKLKAAFKSINGYYWYLRLRGYEIDDVEFGRKSYGNSYALPKPFITLSKLSPILSKLVEKTGSRLRHAGYQARGVHLMIEYRDGTFWHKGMTFPEDIFDSKEIYKKALMILADSPYKKPVHNLAVSVFNLKRKDEVQLNLFEDIIRKRRLTKVVDDINKRWGDFVVASARMLCLDKEAIPDRIAFGGIKELEEFAFNI